MSSIAPGRRHSTRPVTARAFVQAHLILIRRDQQENQPEWRDQVSIKVTRRDNVFICICRKILDDI